MIERRIIQPTQDWIELHEAVAKYGAKRERKLIDYDRHRESYKKAQEAAAAKPTEEDKKLYKVCSYKD
jgi:amphiphysin